MRSVISHKVVHVMQQCQSLFKQIMPAKIFDDLVKFVTDNGGDFNSTSELPMLGMDGSPRVDRSISVLDDLKSTSKIHKRGLSLLLNEGGPNQLRIKKNLRLQNSVSSFHNSNTSH